MFEVGDKIIVKNIIGTPSSFYLDMVGKTGTITWIQAGDYPYNVEMDIDDEDNMRCYTPDEIEIYNKNKRV